jgi:hypothetical protein
MNYYWKATPVCCLGSSGSSPVTPPHALGAIEMRLREGVRAALGITERLTPEEDQ